MFQLKGSAACLTLWDGVPTSPSPNLRPLRGIRLEAAGTSREGAWGAARVRPRGDRRGSRWPAGGAALRKGPRTPFLASKVFSENMLAVHFDKPGGPENLYLKEVAKPSPAEGEVLLKVAASALNRADLLQVPRGQAVAGAGWDSRVFHKHLPDR